MRFRPLAPTERATRCVSCTPPTSLRHTAGDGSTLSFSFDGVHGEDTSQSEIFQEVKDVAQSVLQGYNGCIMAYGQTGV